MRPRRHVLQVSTFPFLAVLLCAMGSLILLLLVIDRRAKAVARAKAMQAIARLTEEEKQAEARRKAELERRRRELHEQLQRQDEDIAAKAHSLQQQAEATSDALNREQTEAGNLQRRLYEVSVYLTKGQEDLKTHQTGLAQTTAKTATTRKELAEMTADLVRLERTVADLKAAREREQHKYSLVPYRGKRGDDRRPIYVECGDGGLVFHPDHLTMPSLAMSAQGIRAEIESRIARRHALASTAAAKEATPYLLMLVRPNGIDTYYRTMKALEGLKIDFGYEFVEADWVLDFPDQGEVAAQPWMTPEKSGSPQVVDKSAATVPPVGVSQPMHGRGIAFGALESTTNGPGFTDARGGGAPSSGPEIGLSPLSVGRPGNPSGSAQPMADGGTGGVSASGPGVTLSPLSVGQSGNPGGFSEGFPGRPTNQTVVTPPATNPSGWFPSAGPGGPFGTPGGGVSGSLPGSSGGPGSAMGSSEGSATRPTNSSDRLTGQPGANPRSGTPNGSSGETDLLLVPAIPGGTPPAAAHPAPAAGLPGSLVGPVASGPSGAGSGAANSPNLASAKPAEGNPTPGQPGDGKAGARQQGPAIGVPQLLPGSDQGTASSGSSTSPSVGASGGSPGSAKGNPSGGPSGGSASPGQPSNAGEETEPADHAPIRPFLQPIPRYPEVQAPSRPRVFSNRDWTISIECTADAVVVPPGGRRIALTALTPANRADNVLLQTVRQMIERRQTMVRPGEPPYRPIIRFLVQPDGLRAYYLAYPALESLQVPMTRENLRKVEKRP